MHCSGEKTPESIALLEALLFLCGEPIAWEDICNQLGWSPDGAKSCINELEQDLQARNRGVMLVRSAKGIQLVTKPELYQQIRWVKKEIKILSPMALETLSIVAFKQPVTRLEIEKIRGVASDRLVTMLLQQELICEVGRRNGPGRAILYGTTDYFLRCMGVDSLEALTGKFMSINMEETKNEIESEDI